MSWLLPSWIGGGSAASTTASTSAPSTTSPRPALHSYQSGSSEDSRKRDRNGWIPRSSSFTTANDESLEPAMSGMRAEGAFDTPRAYRDMARAGVSPAEREEKEQQREQGMEVDEVDDGPPQKKRRGLLGTTLSVGLDAAIFGTSVAYSAYQLWKHPPSGAGDDIDAHLARTSAKSSAQASPLLEAPPPYTYSDRPRSSTSTSTPPPPSQIPRRVRHAHAPRPRPTNTRRSFPPPPQSQSLEPFDSSSGKSTPTTSYLPAAPNAGANYDPFSSLRFPRELPRFQPMEPGTGDGADEMEDGDEEGDEEMRQVAARLKLLIESGTEALASRPSLDLLHEEGEVGEYHMPPSTHSSFSPFPSSGRQISSSIPLPSSIASPRRSLPGPHNTPLVPSSSTSRHARRHSDMSPTKLPVPRSATHTPRHARGFSLGGVPGEGAGSVREDEGEGERVHALRGALEREGGRRDSVGDRGGKGWWER